MKDFFAARTCTRVPAREPESYVLEKLRNYDAYVLLGGPGAGKTEAFKHEAEKEPGCYVTARDFIVLDRSEWCNATLFIDGLDEVRAGVPDGRQPFDTIRTKLDRLNRPRFRLSCRTVDWYGENDSRNLKSVSPNSEVSVFRLDPLSDNAIRECLQHHPGIDDAEEFQHTAETNGIRFLLTNPQRLRMLTELVAGGIWPETRTELFAKTICKLSEEPNQEHTIAHGAVDRDAVIDAAEKLCAVMLLSGAAGYSYTHRDSNPSDCLNLDEVPGETRACLKHALATGLFTENNDCTVPIHAQVAEFLAGRHLAKLIAGGLPIKRILALMIDGSGAIAVGLRGLAAWLATHSQISRLELIALDSLGVALGADAHSFSKAEKTQLLGHLKRAASEHPWFRILDQVAPELGNLAMPEMEEQLYECLENLTPGNNGDTSFALILLEAIKHGSTQQRLASPIMGIVRNSQWEPAIRERALEVYLKLSLNDDITSSELRSLLKDIESGQLSDPQDQLTGQLLEELFPGTLSAAEVLRYLRRPKRPNYYAQYVAFWNNGIVRLSPPDLLPNLLDAFVEQHERLHREITQDSRPYFWFRETPAKLLTRFLQTEPNGIELPRLFAWLGVAAWHRGWHRTSRSGQYIADWLGRHPEEYRSLIKISWEHCVKQLQCTDLSAFERCLHVAEHRFFDASRPRGIDRWYLDQAIATTNRIIQEYLIQIVANAVYLQKNSGSLTVGAVRKEVAHDAFLLEKFQAWLNLLETPDNDRRTSELQSYEKQIPQLIQLAQKRYKRIKQHEEALRENRCPPGVLYRLAQVYFGELSDVLEADPQARLRHFLNNDTALVKAALYGLHRSIDRDDLPNAAEIIRLKAENKTHALALPFLISFEKMMHLGPSGSTPLDQTHVRLALAIRYTDPVYPNWEDQEWYKEIVAKQPEVVADILIQSAKSDLRSKKDCQGNLYALAFFADHASVARLAALPLLRSFHPRATADQFPSLQTLLFAAILWSGKKTFRRLIKRKLDLSSMTVAQRVCWLVAGFWTAPEIYSEKLKSYIAGDDIRIQQVIEFIARAPKNMLGRCKIKSLPVLIQLLGSFCAPWFYKLDHLGMAQRVTPAMKASRRIETWINLLAVNHSKEITQALEGLASDNRLRAWKELLDDVLYDQKELSRKVNFRHPDIRQVVSTLQNRKPANVADLAALIFDKLTEVGRRIRDGSPAEWRQYWNLDSRRKPQNPRHENDCRDTLLSHLKISLKRLRIDAQPEGNYADDNRSDIRVSYDGFNVPVEIKKSSHPDLWTAVEEQLIRKYARDPDTGGYGIYLVFWLGKEQCRFPPSGLCPGNAEELQRQLRDTLTEAQSRKISICVLNIEPF